MVIKEVEKAVRVSNWRAEDDRVPREFPFLLAT